MNITTEQLKARIAQKTGLTDRQVGDSFAELVEEIQEAGSRGEWFHIGGFGSFTEKDGELHFIPDDLLATEINNKYAGMKPIELIGAFKEPETGEMPDMTAATGGQQETWTFDRAQASRDEQKEPSEDQPVHADQPEKEAEPQEVPGADPGEAPDDKLLESVEDPEPANERAEPEEDDAEPAEEHDGSEPEEKEPEPKAPAMDQASGGDDTEGAEGDDTDGLKEDSKESEDRKEVPTPREKDPIGRFVAAAVVVLALGAAGWIGYEYLSGNDTMGTDRALTTESQDVPSEAVKDVQEESLQDEETAETPRAGQESTGSQAEEQENAEPEAPTQVINNEEGSSDIAQSDSYGLDGPLNQSLNSWYTIVVHSLKDENLAEAKKAQIESEGYRVKINQVQVNESLQFRVGIGQFATVEDALDAVGELSEPYKSNNFIKRF